MDIFPLMMAVGNIIFHAILNNFQFTITISLPDLAALVISLGHIILPNDIINERFCNYLGYKLDHDEEEKDEEYIKKRKEFQFDYGRANPVTKVKADIEWKNLNTGNLNCLFYV